jgi:electron transfer flavoprotein alpha subunit
MAIAVFVESDNSTFKKSSFEALGFAKRLADKNNEECLAISIGSRGSENPGVYGASRHVHLNSDQLDTFNPQACAMALNSVLEDLNAQTFILSQTYNGKSIAPILAVKRNASLITGVIGMEQDGDKLRLKKTCFSNKAFAYVDISAERKVLTLVPNSFPVDSKGSDLEVEERSVSIDGSSVNTEVLQVRKAKGKIVLTEAELVVSGGRGLKGPENWGMIEELADVIGAATACSKPVADMDWRPHNEHVGQTGISIKPNLYIAVGISGAIQHLAGVGSSKVICVINTDPEAPFFKAADYGIVGDAFEVVPKLIKRAKEIKGLA